MSLRASCAAVKVAVPAMIVAYLAKTAASRSTLISLDQKRSSERCANERLGVFDLVKQKEAGVESGGNVRLVE